MSALISRLKIEYKNDEPTAHPHQISLAEIHIWLLLKSRLKQNFSENEIFGELSLIFK